jgi:hypothetical protein
MSGDLWRNVGSCQRGRGLEWFRLGSPFPRGMVRDLKILPFIDRQSRTQRPPNDLASGDQSIGKVRAFIKFGLSPVDGFGGRCAYEHIRPAPTENAIRW